jgi:hypothetical protein
MSHGCKISLLAAAPSSPELQDQQFIGKLFCLITIKTQASGRARQIADPDCVFWPAVNAQIIYDVHESGKNFIMESSEDLELKSVPEKHTESAGKKSVTNEYPAPFTVEVKKSSCRSVSNGSLKNIKTSYKVFESATTRPSRPRLFAINTAYFNIPLRAESSGEPGSSTGTRRTGNGRP